MCRGFLGLRDPAAFIREAPTRWVRALPRTTTQGEGATVQPDAPCAQSLVKIKYISPHSAGILG